MPAQSKITKEIILEGAVETLRLYGNSGLSVRNIAKVLGCSTQPIYSVFANMDELKRELFFKASLLQEEIVASYMGKTLPTNYKAYGMGFVRFAKEEKELFKFLYMQEPSDLFSQSQDINYEAILKEIQNNYHFSREDAAAFHTEMSIFTYGLAVLQSIGRNMTDEEVSQELEKEFKALYAIYKK